MRKSIYLAAAIIISMPIVSHPAISNKDFFTFVYKKNAWGSQNSRSGSGSTFRQTINIRTVIPALLKKLGAKVFLDAPCGDFYWMKEVDLSFLDQYIGADIVNELIESNQAQYGNEKRSFKIVDIVNDATPQADVILCRDCLQHLPDKDVFSAINNFKKSKSKYLLVSNHPNATSNTDMGEQELHHSLRCRYRNLLLPPFNFPKPIIQFDEGFEGKVLTLWKIADLPDYN